MQPANGKSDTAIRAGEKLPPKSSLRKAVTVVFAVAEAIRDAGEIPSGHLYAAIMSKVDLDEYESVIDLLIKAELVKRDNSHLLHWIGPKLEVQ